MKPPARPDWFAEWLKEQGKYIRLACGCIEDFNAPQCLELLTGKTILIMCPFDLNHGFQKVVASLKFREVLKERGIEFPEPDGLIPPF